MKKYIGNVIVKKMNFKVEDCFKKCLSLSEIDTTLPTLIVGLENAKSIIEDFNILTKRYENDMLWWTFNKMERRVDYEKDVLDFHNFCIKNIINNSEYHFVSLIDMKYSTAKKCLNFIKNCDEKHYYVDNNKFVFVYKADSENHIKHIYGFSLNTCAFFGIRKEKIIKLIESNKHNHKIKNFYLIPNSIRHLVNDDIPSEILLLEYF